MNLRYLSLFSGIGGFDLAVQTVFNEAVCVGHSEIDKYAEAIYQKHFHNPNFGDIRAIKPHSLPDFDLLVAGFPCQDLSIAKAKRKGLKGERSGLFWDMLSILNVKKPKYFLIENVASMPKEDKRIISEVLGVEPVMINASLVSAQSRKRLFWCNWKVKQPKDRHIYLKDILEDENKVKQKKYFVNFEIYKDDAFFDEADKPIKVGQMSKGGQAGRIYSVRGKSVTLKANGGGGGAKTGLYLITGVAKRTRDNGKVLEARKDNKANSLTTVSTDSMALINNYVRKLTPIECERLQGFPDGWTEGVSNTRRYKALGNAVNVEVVKHILNELRKGMEK